jgi:hypothetical protein
MLNLLKLLFDNAQNSSEVKLVDEAKIKMVLESLLLQNLFPQGAPASFLAQH